MFTMRMKKLIVGVAVLAAPVFAMAQSAEQLIQKYTPLAGNKADNAKALVNGLRDGTEVVMYMEQAAPPPPPPPPPLFFGAPLPPVSQVVTVGMTELVPVKCTPPTGKMGFGNVDNALTLAQGSLANMNIVAGTAQTGQRAATGEDVCIVLMGGNVTTPQGTKIRVPGILKLRSEGGGWGEIAQQVGAKL